MCCWFLRDCIADNLIIEQIKKRVKISFLLDTLFIILKFCGISCEFLMWYGSLKSSVKLIFSESTNLTFIRTIFSWFTPIWSYLKSKFFHQTCTFLWLTEIPLCLSNSTIGRQPALGCWTHILSISCSTALSLSGRSKRAIQ